MTQTDFARAIAALLRNNNIRKPVKIPQRTLHISDDDGNCKDITIKGLKKQAPYSVEDVETIIEAGKTIIQEALKRGESLGIKGFGTLGLKYRKPRSTKDLFTGEKIVLEGRYLPKFNFGSDLRLCAKIYQLSLRDAEAVPPIDSFDDFDEIDDSDEE